MTNIKRNYTKAGNALVSFTDSQGRKVELVLQDYSLKLKIDGKYKNTIINNLSLDTTQDALETAVKLYAKTYTDTNAVAKTSVTTTVTNVSTEVPNGPAVTTLFNSLGGGGAVKFTPEGGLAIRVVNGTGSESVKGTVVSASPTADNSFVLQSNEFDTIGIVYESGIADGSLCWIVVAGIAEVLLKDTTASTRGQVALAADTDGRMVAINVPSSNPVVAEHFKEIGHVMESKIAGTDVLVKCMIHFN